MNVGICGLGLMGGSFGRTLYKNTDCKVYGYDISESVLLKAQLLNAVHGVLDENSAKEIDLLVISVFPRDFKSVAEKFLPFLKSGATVLDFCGIKRLVIEDMKALHEKYPNINFIGGHPMAGREFSGIDHSVTTLFNKSSMILVPVFADIFIESQLKKFFLSIGCDEVVVTDAETHDKNIAFTSQMCHITSSAFIKSPTAERHFGYSAGSYKDLTRVARMNPEMWTQLVTENSDNILNELNVLIDNLSEYRNAIKNKDEELLKKLFDEGNQIKLRIDVGRKNDKTNS